MGSPSEQPERFEILAKFSMSERSEFWNFALKKFQISEEKQRSRGVLSFAYFSLHEQSKSKSPSAKYDIDKIPKIYITDIKGNYYANRQYSNRTF